MLLQDIQAKTGIVGNYELTALTLTVFNGSLSRWSKADQKTADETELGPSGVVPLFPKFSSLFTGVAVRLSNN